MTDPIPLLIAVTMGMGIVIGAGCLYALKQPEIAAFQAEAIKRNAAHWKVDGATGKTEFEWNEVK